MFFNSKERSFSWVRTFAGNVISSGRMFPVVSVSKSLPWALELIWRFNSKLQVTFPVTPSFKVQGLSLVSWGRNAATPPTRGRRARRRGLDQGFANRRWARRAGGRLRGGAARKPVMAVPDDPKYANTANIRWCQGFWPTFATVDVFVFFLAIHSKWVIISDQWAPTGCAILLFSFKVPAVGVWSAACYVV